MGKLVKEGGVWLLDGEPALLRVMKLQIEEDSWLYGVIGVDGLFRAFIYRPKRFRLIRCESCGWMIRDEETGGVVDLSDPDYAYVTANDWSSAWAAPDPTPPGQPSLWEAGGPAAEAEILLNVRRPGGNPKIEIKLTSELLSAGNFIFA